MRTLRTLQIGLCLGLIAAGITIVAPGRSIAPSAPERSAIPPDAVFPVSQANAIATPSADEPHIRTASALTDMLDRLIALTRAQESAKDATCWTTVRMMDAHFSGRTMSDAVGLLKIEACKSLVYERWVEAARRCVHDGSLTADDVRRALPASLAEIIGQGEALDAVVAADPVAAVMRRDYHRVTESKRYLLSIIEEAVTHTGLFHGRPVDIRALDDPAIAAIAAAGTAISTEFLTRCGRHAAARSHDGIQDDDVRSVFSDMEAELAFLPASQAGDGRADALDVSDEPKAIDDGIMDATRRLIDEKITALRAWNAKIWTDAAHPESREAELLSRFCKVPFDREGYAQLRVRLRTYASYIAMGMMPQPLNTLWTSAAGHHGIYQAPPSDSRPLFVSLAWTANALENLFPRSIAPNGDVTVGLVAMASRYVGDDPAERAVRSTRLLDWELDAVRDTAIHWSIISDVYRYKGARPADPFALELLADRLSEVALLFVKACDSAATADHASAITGEICKHVLERDVFVVPRPPSSWTAEQECRKASVVSSYPGPLFRNASAAAGFPQHGCVARRSMTDFNRPEAGNIDLMGSGIAVGDVDGDGLPDLFLAGDGGNRLMRNLGDHRFEDITARAGIDDPNLDDASHPLLVDYDNDGRLDLLVVHSRSPPRLFHQEASGHFTDATVASGLIAIPPLAHDAVWFDYDNDGLLDLYVSHYGMGAPALDGRNGAPNQLFHNLGGGRFEDVTARAGVGSTGWTLAAAAIDIDHDGLMDLYVANDFGRSELFHNDGNGMFSEVGERYGVDDRGSSMNASVVDIDHDGWMDLYVTQIDMFSKSIGFVFPRSDSRISITDRILKSTFTISGNKLFLNDHGRRFRSVEPSWFEPADRGWSWSANFFDYDNDGEEDMYLSNGWIDGTPAGQQRKQMFIRQGGAFYVVDPAGPESYLGNSRGVVAADLTGNGHMDLVVDNFDAGPALLDNACTSGNHWLKVRLHGTRCNRAGIGAVVKVVVAEGGHPLWKMVSCGSNYLSQEDTVLTFGLGAHASAIGLSVTWPGDIVQDEAGPLKGDTVIDVTQADASKASDAPPRAP